MDATSAPIAIHHSKDDNTNLINVVEECNISDFQLNFVGRRATLIFFPSNELPVSLNIHRAIFLSRPKR